MGETQKAACCIDCVWVVNRGPLGSMFRVIRWSCRRRVACSTSHLLHADLLVWFQSDKADCLSFKWQRKSDISEMVMCALFLSLVGGGVLVIFLCLCWQTPSRFVNTSWLQLRQQRWDYKLVAVSFNGAFSGGFFIQMTTAVSDMQAMGHPTSVPLGHCHLIGKSLDLKKHFSACLPRDVGEHISVANLDLED